MAGSVSFLIIKYLTSLDRIIIITLFSLRFYVNTSTMVLTGNFVYLKGLKHFGWITLISRILLKVFGIAKRGTPPES